MFCRLLKTNMKIFHPIIIALYSAPFIKSSANIESKEEIQQVVRTLFSLYPLFSSHSTDQSNDQSSKSFSILDSEAIYNNLISLAELYPNFATLENAQDIYDLPAAGNETDCLFEKAGINNINETLDNEKGCKNWIFTIEDNINMEISNKNLPELFLSGGIHGDETVSPTALVELASLLLEVAQCESLPNGEPPSSSDIATVNQKTLSDWDDQLTEAVYCRRTLAARGITNYYRKWIARLVVRRRIVIVPVANSLGFYRKEHSEDGIDPATDFPFDNNDSKRCMETITARVFNEIFRSHMFYIAINFHSGKPLIGYNWATPSYSDAYTPDNEAQNQIAIGLATFGGMDNWGTKHLIGPMNKLVVKTKGTMEDWAYAGSWINSNTCNPTTYNGYPEDKTVYNDSQLRALSMVVDFSELKNPSGSLHLGNQYDLFHPQSFEDGHIPRLLRASLMMIDIVEPYVTIKSIHGTQIQDDVVPSLFSRTDRWSNTKSKSVSIPQGTENIDILWEVGGAFSVDTTNLLYVKLKFDGNMLQQKKLNELMHSFYKTVDGDEGFFSSAMKDVFYESPSQSGNTRWNKSPSDTPPMFQSTVNLTQFDEGDLIAVFATAQVDNMWEDQPDTHIAPDLPPQTHLVNARLNPSWHHENAGRLVKGKVDFFSIPVTLVIGPPDSKTEELHLRIPKSIKTYDSRKKIQNIMFIAIASVLLFAIVGTIVYRKRRPSLQKERSKRYSISGFSDDEDEEYLEKIYKYSLGSTVSFRSEELIM